MSHIARELHDDVQRILYCLSLNMVPSRRLPQQSPRRTKSVALGVACPTLDLVLVLARAASGFEDPVGKHGYCHGP